MGPPPVAHMVRAAQHVIHRAEFDSQVAQQVVGLPQGSHEAGIDSDDVLVPLGHDGRTHTGLE
ncbi:hypothetical protein [Streptomyces sp. NPDC050564]|uniref:hypothetical protein n=1 Tax=Streptomyces sp. NPDC050564 TaxID=3365631 RepID=UPI0037AB3EC5